MLMGLDYLEVEHQPALKKRRIVGKGQPAGSKTTTKKLEDSLVEVRIIIPVLMNSVPIESGGELLLFKAKALPRPRAQVPITMQALSKSLRSAKASTAAAASSKAASSATF